MKKRETIYLYTDGASSGNPGPGGYGIVLVCGQQQKEISGGFRLTTNNRMELLAVIKGLEAIKWSNAEVVVVSDSSYVVNAINQNWLKTWASRGFTKIKNPDLWIRLHRLLSLHRVNFQWIKGHAGHPFNERCDFLAVQAGVGAVNQGIVLPEDKGYNENNENNINFTN